MRRGVSFYTQGQLEWSVHFPNGEETCRWCPFAVKDGLNYLRMVCLLTGEILAFPETSRGCGCPLQIGRTEEPD